MNDVKLHIVFSVENDAFQHNLASECRRILLEVASKLESNRESYGMLFDSNGNAVGNWSIGARIVPLCEEQI